MAERPPSSPRGSKLNPNPNPNLQRRRQPSTGPQPSSNPDPSVQAYPQPPQNQPAAVSSASSTQSQPKVAIPRLPQDAASSGGNSSKGGRHRVGHACEPCRIRKTKCSGEKPVCKHCQDFKLTCYYADGKRDKAKKQFGTMTEKVQDYEALLRDLGTRVSEKDADLIQKSLEKGASTPIDSPFPTDAGLQDLAEPESDGESQVSASVGSTGAVDRVEEDFNRSDKARATGFIGKNSEITWLQRLKQEVRVGSPPSESDHRERSKRNFQEKAGGASPMFDSRGRGTPLQDVDEGFSATATSYHLDDLPIFISESVDPYEIPPRDVADNLFRTYLNTTHFAYPIIGKTTFINQYQKFFSSNQSRPGNKWLAILNLIFAIASKHAQLARAEWAEDERVHLIYFTRARMLGMTEEIIFDHPDLQLVQIEGLLSFYFLCINQINRAWTFAGMAIRAGIGLGINMRNESTSTPDASKEIRYRVWWALYTLEHLLCIMTGRPTSILDYVCTTPLPVPLEEENFQTESGVDMLGNNMQKNTRFPVLQSRSSSSSTPSSSISRRASKPSGSPATPLLSKYEWSKNVAPNHSLFFLHYVHLMRINQEVLNKIYTPANAGETWSQVQSTIEELEKELATWRESLPPVFEFSKNQRDQTFLRQRLGLGLAYYGTRITITRPTLCRLDRKIPHQSGISSTFNREAASTCVLMARDMLDMMPDEPDPTALYKASPWWCILHYLMQSTSILMLELSFRAHHMPEEAENNLDSAKKAVRWLHAMGGEDLAARRAWVMCDDLIREVAPKIGRTVDDLPSNPPEAEPPFFEPIDFAGQILSQDSLRPPAPSGLAQDQDFLPMLQSQIMDPPMYSTFDEYYPWNPTTGELTSSLFPTASQMEAGMVPEQEQEEEEGQQN